MSSRQILSMLCLLVLLTISGQALESETPPLTLRVSCRDNAPCMNNGKTLFLEIRLHNATDGDIGFPLDYRRKTGPVIRLINPNTKAEALVQNNLADPDLEDNLTTIPAGQSAALEWVVMADELRDVGKRSEDLSAEITVRSKIRVDGRRIDFFDLRCGPHYPPSLAADVSPFGRLFFVAWPETWPIDRGLLLGQ